MLKQAASSYRNISLNEAALDARLEHHFAQMQAEVSKIKQTKLEKQKHQK